MKKPCILIVGDGQVGTVLSAILQAFGYVPIFHTSRDSWESFLARLKQVACVVIAIRNTNRGEDALRYAMGAVTAGKPVVTVEKAMTAYHFDKVKACSPLIRYTASVGGGSKLLSLFDRYYVGLRSITAFLNGTLNFLSSECARGVSPDEAFDRAAEKRLCEPGKQRNHSMVFLDEFYDIILKTCIVWNSSGISSVRINPDDFGKAALSTEFIHGILTSKKKSMRFAMVIGRRPSPAIRDSIYDGLRIRRDGWHIEIGLADTTLLPLDLLLPDGEGNVMVIEHAHGKAVLGGPGAGPIPTSLAILDDVSEAIRLSPVA